jgi:LmbE family N-acetylglucosaminyl deacetylase
MFGIGRRLIGRFWRHAEPRFDRRLRPALRNDPAAPALLLSPHLDDAVIDCWSVLTAPGELNVVTVCAGIPPAGGATRWDLIAGAADSAELMRARIDEDAGALARAGRSGRNLPFLEGHYREHRREPSLKAIDRALGAVVRSASKVFVPAVLGTAHGDHVRVRAYGEALARHGMPVELYADLPYAVVYGWPHWVTGDEPDPHLDVDAYWSARPDGSARIVKLDDEQAAAKLEAMRAYATQFPTLDRGPIGLLSNPRIHRFEIFWTCASS